MLLELQGSSPCGGIGGPCIPPIVIYNNKNLYLREAQSKYLRGLTRFANFCENYEVEKGETDGSIPFRYSVPVDIKCDYFLGFTLQSGNFLK